MIDDPAGYLGAYLANEWSYYDGIADDTPDRIVPIGVLAPASVNAYAFRGGASNLRNIHLGLAAACDPLLPDTPVDSDLCTESDLDGVGSLLHEAIQVPQVLLPVTTKVLFRKRRRLIPMLDNVVLGNYFELLGRLELLRRLQDKSRAADGWVACTRRFQVGLDCRSGGPR